MLQIINLRGKNLKHPYSLTAQGGTRGGAGHPGVPELSVSPDLIRSRVPVRGLGLGIIFLLIFEGWEEVTPLQKQQRVTTKQVIPGN